MNAEPNPVYNGLALCRVGGSGPYCLRECHIVAIELVLPMICDMSFGVCGVWQNCM